MSLRAGRTLLSQDDENRWKTRHSDVSSSRALAGLFRGWMPEGYESASRRILYVGKATSGLFNKQNDEYISFTARRGTFWRFAEQIARSVGGSDKDLSCIAWSNISKVSLPQITADPSLIDGFLDDAALTLEAEIATAKPHVVIFVTNHFCEQVVRVVSGGQLDSEWSKSELESPNAEEADVWWRRRQDGVAVLWMRHPQGASTTLRNYAVKKIGSLADGL